MKVEKILIAAVAGGVTLFATGYIIYELIFANASIGMEPAAEGVLGVKLDLSGIIVMELLFGLLLAVTLNWKGTNGFSSGLIPGGLIGVIIGITINLYLLSTTDLINFNSVIYDGITFLIRFAIAGGVVALIYGKAVKQAAE